MKARSEVNPFLSTVKPLGVSPTGVPYKVLLIDDSDFIIKQLSQILSSEGFEIVGKAKDGLIGLNQYKELHSNVDLVTIDITMPTMDGLSCLQNLIDFNPNIKAIMVTAIGSNDVIKQGLAIGAKNYIVKPLNRDKVLERVIKAINP